MTRLLLWILPALAVLLAAGCSGPRPPAPLDADLPDAFPYHNADQIRFFLEQGVDSLRAFEAKTSFAVRSPERSGSFSGDLRSRRNDSLYLSLSPGFGIEAARALVTPDSFYLYDRLKKRVLYGALDDAGDLLPAAFTADDLFRALLGLQTPEPGTDWTVTADSGYYYLADAPTRRLFVVDPSLWRVIRYEERTVDGAVLEERLFAEFDRFDGAVLPRRVVFRRPLDASTASLYYRSLDLNPGRLSFDLRVSREAKYEPVR